MERQTRPEMEVKCQHIKSGCNEITEVGRPSGEERGMVSVLDQGTTCCIFPHSEGSSVERGQGRGGFGKCVGQSSGGGQGALIVGVLRCPPPSACGLPVASISRGGRASGVVHSN